MTDRAIFAWLCDVFVPEVYRGRGLSKGPIESVIGYPALHGVQRFLLNTRDAHGLYEQCGFPLLANSTRFMEVFRLNVY